jgi:hypothetical protein
MDASSIDAVILPWQNQTSLPSPLFHSEAVPSNRQYRMAGHYCTIFNCTNTLYHEMNGRPSHGVELGESVVFDCT